LRLAEKILPEIDALSDEFRALQMGKTGRLHIAMECHACFDWLFLVLEPFRRAWPEVDVDIRAGLAFDAFPALLREEIDLVITSDPSNMLGVVFNPLFDYHPMFVAASNNPLAQKTFITAEDFRDQLLITYPVARDKLDVFTEVLNPAKIEPRATRQVELTAMILMLVAANRGVSVLPDWVLRDVRSNADFVTLPLGPHPVVKRLYAATRAEDATKPYMAQFLRLSRSEPVKLQRNL
jgi:LysR family transcriptional regulator, regulator for metE and metH